MGHTISGAGNGGAYCDVETPTFKDLNYKDNMVRYIAHGCVSQRRTDITGASESNSSRESTNTTDDDSKVEGREKNSRESTSRLWRSVELWTN